jgi:hypothetical protein
MEEIFNLKKIYLAYLDCRKKKRKTINALKFEWNLERNLFSLQKELLTKKYKPGRSICFVVREPVPREIFAGNFRDRVVQHLLVREVESQEEKDLIFDTFSCRKNKGTHSAVNRLKEFIGRASDNYSKKVYYAKLDISGFFMSIDQHILYKNFRDLALKCKRNLIWQKDLFWLAETIIFYKPTQNYLIKGDRSLFSLVPNRKSLFCSNKGKGLPIGNHSSQFFANLYLNELDQFVKRKLKCKYYIRYVDDIVILAENKKKLKSFRDEINYFLIKSLNLELNDKKTIIQPLDKGIDFLGYFIKLGYSLVRRRVVKKLKNKLYKLNNCPDCLNYPPSRIVCMINSYFGHFGHANSFNLRKKFVKKL